MITIPTMSMMDDAKLIAARMGGKVGGMPPSPPQPVLNFTDFTPNSVLMAIRQGIDTRGDLQRAFSVTAYHLDNIIGVLTRQKRVEIFRRGRIVCYRRVVA